MAAERNGFRKEDLWQYQYRYFTLFGFNLVPISIMRRFFGVLTADDIDFFLEKGILSQKEIGMAGGVSGITPAYVIEKLSAALPKARLLPDLAKTLKNLPMYPIVKATMPAVWDDKKVSYWLDKYRIL